MAKYISWPRRIIAEDKKKYRKMEREIAKAEKLREAEKRKRYAHFYNRHRKVAGKETLPETPVKRRTANHRKPKTDTKHRVDQKQIRYRSPSPIRATDDDREPYSICIDNNNLIDSMMPFDQPFVMCSLKNIGNTCFMNSALYCLRFLPTFLHHLHHFVNNIMIVFKDDQDVETMNCVLSRASVKLDKLIENPANRDYLPKFNDLEKSKGYIIDQLHTVFKTMVDIETGTIKSPFQPYRFRWMLREFDTSFTMNDQHDAHECLKLILTAMQEFSQDLINKCERMFAGENGELNSSLSLNYFEEYFVGKRVMTLNCARCDSAKSQPEPLVELLIPLTSNMKLRENFIQNLCFKKQMLDGSNKVNCDLCITQTVMTQSYTYQKLPLILIVQLGRFNERLEKVDTVAPISFDLKCFCESCIGGRTAHRYSLVGVIVHTGLTSKSGHYIAYVRAPQQESPLQCSSQSCCQINVKANRNEWFICNDDDITRIPEVDLMNKMKSESEAKSKTPYVLFYARNDIHAVQ